MTTIGATILGANTIAATTTIASTTVTKCAAGITSGEQIFRQA
jgi:hypothetical protein